MAEAPDGNTWLALADRLVKTSRGWVDSNLKEVRFATATVGVMTLVYFARPAFKRVKMPSEIPLNKRRLGRLAEVQLVPNNSRSGSPVVVKVRHSPLARYAIEWLFPTPVRRESGHLMDFQLKDVETIVSSAEFRSIVSDDVSLPHDTVGVEAKKELMAYKNGLLSDGIRNVRFVRRPCEFKDSLQFDVYYRPVWGLLRLQNDLVKRGFAQVKDDSDDRKLRKLERAARSAKSGFWANASKTDARASHLKKVKKAKVGWWTRLGRVVGLG